MWDRPQDPTVYGVMDLVVDRALPYLDELGRAVRDEGPGHPPGHQGPRPRHPAHPQANGIVTRRRLALRSDVDIFVQVATEGGRDLSGTKLTRVDEMPLAEIARELAERAARVRRHDDPGVERTKSLVHGLPNALLGLTMRLMEFLLYDLQLDLSRFGIESDQFGSAMVSNIGNFEGFGMTFALAPLVPISRCPIVVLIGEVQRKPVVEGDRWSSARRDARLHVRSSDDRRARGTAIAAVLRRVVEDPEKDFGPVSSRLQRRAEPRPDRRALTDRAGATARQPM